VHSLVDTGDQLLLLYGMHRAKRPPDAYHPLGYGRELYFWCFIVAVLIFAVGAGVSFYEGVSHVLNPRAIVDARVNYAVLGLAFLFESGSWYVAWKEFRAANPDIGYFEGATRSKDPPSFIVLFEDSAALLGILIALAGTLAAEYFEQPVLDGVASIGIALVLAATAIFLAVESKSLLIGEPASRATRDGIMQIAGNHRGIEGVNKLITVHLAPDQVIAALNLDFDDRRSVADIETDVAALESAIKKDYPEVTEIFIKPQKSRRPAADAASPRNSSSVADQA
jgi:cation diffusion facilitator family transporter